MSSNVKTILFSIALLAGAFVVGAFWSYRELWPYKSLRDLKSRLVEPAPPPATYQRQIVTNLGTLDLSSFALRSRVPIEPVGGGIAAFDDKVLVMSLRGQFYVYEGMDAAEPVIPLNLTLDNGYDLFRKYIFRHDLMAEDSTKYFRFIDVIYDRESSPPALLVSHHQWNDASECFTLRLSKLELKADGSLFVQSAVSDDWHTVYETKPCLSIDPNVGYFTGDQSGGRIVLVSPDSVLFSVGDHAFDGWTIPEMLPQDTANDYGKILLVQLGTGLASQVSIGHRNPQGLMVDRDGFIWSTEHGPRGGDELNLISDGGNYGWPHVTYGAQYGMSRWPISETQNRHDGYVRPVFAWLPSIGVSNLIQVERFLPVWDGDLLVSSLRGRMLHRIRYQDGGVLFEERIEIGERIRDLDQLDDGTIVTWTDEATIIELKPGVSVEPDMNVVVAALPAEKRQQARSTIGLCLQCHSAVPGGATDAAPNLWRVFGRRIAGTDYAGYSEGLKSKSGTWDDDALDSFLSDVNRFSSGSNMSFAGIPDDSIRATVIDYLKALTQADRGGVAAAGTPD